MTDYAPANINRTFINAPIATVWSTLVATDKPLPFFFGTVCDTKDGLKEGASMRMLHPNGKLAMVVGEVMAFEPPHRYSHTFQMTSIDEPPCKITYTLTEKEGGTEFELMIENAVEGSKLFKEVKGGQAFISGNLKALCETGKPAISGRMVTLLSPIFGLISPKVRRIENWPLKH